MATQYIQEDPNIVAQTLLQGLTGAIQAQADRPVKTSATTTTTSKPLEYSDLLARRNQIGAERAMLNEALKQRETFGYGLANALASMPAQQGAGSWLGDFARGFGSAFNARANAAIDRAKQDYESAQADLATALAFDKAMGDRQIQSEGIGYTPLPMGGSGVGGTGEIMQPLYGVSKDFNPAEYYSSAQGFDAAGRLEDAFIKGDSFAERLVVASGLPKTIQGKEGSINRITLGEDVAKFMVQPRVFELVKGANSVRIADSDEEKRYIIGPLMKWETMNNEQIATEIARGEDRWVAKFYEQAEKQGVDPSIFSEDEVRARWRSLWSDPRKYIKEYIPSSSGNTQQAKTFAEQFRERHNINK